VFRCRSRRTTCCSHTHIRACACRGIVSALRDTFDLRRSEVLLSIAQTLGRGGAQFDAEAQCRPRPTRVHVLALAQRDAECGTALNPVRWTRSACLFHLGTRGVPFLPSIEPAQNCKSALCRELRSVADGMSLAIDASQRLPRGRRMTKFVWLDGSR